jgi:hypothetical protein
MEQKMAEVNKSSKILLGSTFLIVLAILLVGFIFG